MKNSSAPTTSQVPWGRSGRLSAFATGLLAALCSSSALSAVPIDSKPMTVANSVPNNMILVPSFEWPTAITHANDPGATEANASYNSSVSYSGYFNSDVCYDYVYYSNEKDRHFRPAVAAGNNHTCSGKWSGNFLNWATAQAVDTFRMALTGGYRVKDDANGNTWLEKAESDRLAIPSWGKYNDLRKLSSGASAVMPGFSQVRTRIGGLHNQMWFVGSTGTSLGNNNSAVTVGDGLQSGGGLTKVVPYGYGGTSGAVTNQGLATNTTCPQGYSYNSDLRLCTKSGSANVPPTAWGNTVVLAVSVRVQVCDDAGIDRRPFCKQYGSHWKPEGLIQANSKKLRYSVFGYQTSDENNEGAVLRARQKLVGPVMPGEKPYPDRVGRIAAIDNPEWDVDTGVLIDNPDVADALATSADIGNGTCTRPDGSSGDCSIQYSGVINYINRFGQVDTGATVKLKGGTEVPISNSGYNGGADNVADLYYAALRYIRGLGGESSGTHANYLLAKNYGGGNSSAASDKYKRADGMPAIRNWYNTGPETGVRWSAGQKVGTDYDPILYQCQANVLLGIGDTSTNESRDTSTVEDLRGSSSASLLSRLKGESASISLSNGTSGGARANALAALAMWAHLTDLRPDVPNTVLSTSPDRKRGQSVSTYWVDVVERSDYLGPTTNQYYLATKYGGFAIPDNAYDRNGNAYDWFSLGGGNDPWPNKAWWDANPGAWTSRSSNITVPNGGGGGGYRQPNNMFFANNGQAMIEGLGAAFQRITDDVSGSGGSFASNTTKLEVGSRTYQAKYISNGWGGRLTASDVNTATGELIPKWDASDWLGQAPGDARVNNSAVPLAYTDRAIYYNNGGDLANFLTPSLARPGAFSSVTDNQVRYILGDRSHERQFGAAGTFRNRRGMLGDIINSTPVYVGRPNANLYAGDTSYAEFVQDQASRTPVVYVGANDGMLHAFKAPDSTTSCDSLNAGCGRELFAFMPTEAMSVLTQNDPENNRYPYWDPEYDHAYSVDGEMTVADVKGSDGLWRTVLVGTMGRGGKSIFALDVTDPEAPELLWEKTASDPAVGSLLGNALGRPIIAKTSAGWRVFLGNGPNSAAGTAALIILDALTGDNRGSVNTGVAGNNGLSAVNVWDDHGAVIPSKPDGIFDTVYAGDMNGNLWKFDLDNNTFTSLFTTQTGQPITAAPLVARNPYNPPETWVFFGTGRYLSMADTSAAANAITQSWYGIIDRDATVTLNTLNRSSITHQDNIGRVIEKVGAPGTNGWYIDLEYPAGTPNGERMVLPNFFQGMALIGTTRYPDSTDPCAPSGRGYTMAIDPFTGGRLGSAFFDMNGNGTVGDSGDYYGGNTSTPYSGVGYDSGPNNPIFLGPYMYTSLDSGSYSKIMTSGAQALVRRVSWRELLNAN